MPPPESTNAAPTFVRPGATWWKVDFHAHSPSSFDFNGLEGETTTERPSTDEWLLTYMRAGVDAIVVTDHNTGAGVDLARASLSELESAGHPDYRAIAVFGGVEITVDGGYHLLGVFDVDTSSDVVTRVLNRCDYPGEFGGSDSSTAKSFRDVVKEVVGHGGLAIPAHADGTAGYFRLAAASRSAVEADGLICAVEVSSPEGLCAAEDLKWVPVLGSDAHFLDSTGAENEADAKYPGSHFTWVKMQKPTLDGLRLALADGSSSVIPNTGTPQDPNQINHSTIESITVTKQGETRTYEFSPWMNALIGGRGVGKSTLLEIVRLVLDRTDELPQNLAEDLKFFSPIGSPGHERFWDTSTEIEVFYRKSGKRYRVSWSGGSPMTPEIASFDGTDWESEEGSVRDRFPIFMYSQKQIYEIARQPQSLLAIIDSQPEVEFATWEQDFETMCDAYKTARRELAAVLDRIGNISRLRGDLLDVDAQLDTIAAVRDSPIAKELAELKALEAADSMNEIGATTAEEHLTNAIQALETATASADDVAILDVEPGESGQPEVHEQANFSQFDDPDSSWVPRQDRDNAIESATGSARSALQLLEDSRITFESSGPSPRAERIGQLELEIAELNSSSDTEDSTIVDYTALSDRKTNLETQIKGLVAEEESLTEIREHTTQKLAEIHLHRGQLTTNRMAYVGSLPSEEIKMKVIGQADRGLTEAHLRNLFQTPAAFDSIFLGDSGFQKTLEDNPFSPDVLPSIARLKTLMVELQSDTVSETTAAMIAALSIEARFISRVRTLNSFDFETEVNLWFPDDLLHIQYRPEGEPNFKSINHGSPGQRTAALLTAILQMSDDPLILDQPEDDLDNKLIYELVVKTLHRTKSSRQVIVATHNANVVVLGDAEHVMVMENGNLPHVEHSGSIQAGDIKSSICKIMEGGETAFEARYRRLASSRR